MTIRAALLAALLSAVTAQVALANLPLGACCVATGACQDLMSTQCDDQNGEFIGEGTECSAVDCEAPLAAPLLSIAGVFGVIGILGGLGVYRLVSPRPRD